MSNTEEIINNQKKYMMDVGYDFFQNPTRDNFVNLILKNTGEQDNLDFKEEWIDEQKLAKRMLGIANVGNGAIVFGLKELKEGTFEPVGLKQLMDKSIISSKIKKYLPKELKFDILDFNFTGENYSKLPNRLFQILFIFSKNENLPYPLETGFEKIERGTIFYRKGTETLLADTEAYNVMFSKRINAEKTIQKSLEFKDHLEQIKLLYEYYTKASLYGDYSNSVILGFALFQKDIFNQRDSFEKFLSEMIEKKKKKIEEILEISSNDN